MCLLVLGLILPNGIRIPISNTTTAISLFPRLGSVKLQIESLFSREDFEKLALIYANVFLISSSFVIVILAYLIVSNSGHIAEVSNTKAEGSSSVAIRKPISPLVASIVGFTASTYLLHLILFSPQVMPIGSGMSAERAIWSQYAVFILFGLFNLFVFFSCIPIIRRFHKRRSTEI